MRFRPVFLFISLSIVLLIAVNACGSGGKEAAVYFAAEDPEGDDYGPGTYVYPRDPAFEPYEGLFDLLAFKVWGDRGEEVYFDVTIKNVTNPWAAPEGFIHPVIHIYVVTGRGTHTEPVNEGPRVAFSPRYPWEFCLTGIGWENSAVYHPAVAGRLQETPIKAVYLQAKNLIRLAVPKKVIGIPETKWRYHVLIGSYDGFGPGFFREVKEQADDWFFGGGTGDNIPRVLDLLAPAGGKYSQENQMRLGKGGLYPAGAAGRRPALWWLWLLLGVSLVIFLLHRRPVFSFFWYKEKKN